MANDYVDRPALSISYLWPLDELISFLHGNALLRGAIGATVLPPRVEFVSSEISAYEAFLLGRVSGDILGNDIIKDELHSYIVSIFGRASALPTSGVAFYQDYGYLGFDDVAVLSYAGQRSISELRSALDSLALVVDTGPVPSGTESDLHPIPGLHHVVEVPGYSDPVIPDWIASSIRLKTEMVFLLVLGARLIEAGLEASPAGAGTFEAEAQPFLLGIAQALRDFDRKLHPASSSSDSLSLSSSSGGSGASSGSGHPGTSTVAPPGPPPPGSSTTAPPGPPPPGSSTTGPPGPPPPPQDSVRNIVLIGMWPPSCDAVMQFAEVNPLPPGTIPSGWAGWQGANWKNRGFNIVSYFPTFDTTPPPEPPLGHVARPFIVDYKQAAEDFWNTIPPLKPVALIAITRGKGWHQHQNNTYTWKFEIETRNLEHASWADYWSTYMGTGAGGYSLPNNPHVQVIGGSAEDKSPFQNPAGPIADDPPDSTRSAGSKLYSQLFAGVPGIVAAVQAANPTPHPVIAADDAGSFVSEWIGYLCNWYGTEKSAVAVAKDEQCPIHGSIHVASRTSPGDAAALMEATLDAVTKELNARQFP